MTNRKRVWEVLAMVLIVHLGAAAHAIAQNCPGAVPTDDTPDHSAIQACLDEPGVTQVYLVPGSPGYIIGDKIRFRSDDKLLTSVGGKARLLAHPDLAAPILEVQGADAYEISEIIFDGNVSARTQAAARCAGPSQDSSAQMLF